MQWFLAAIKNYAGFSGRARRTEYWMFFLFYIIFYVVAVVLDTVLSLGFLTVVYSLGLLIPSLAVGVRRLHDTNRSGWWLLIGLVPLVGAIVLLVFFVEEGTGGSNQYGTDPKGGPAATPPPVIDEPPATP